MGKTALLEYAAEKAAGIRLLRAAGTESERGIGFGGLQQLLHATSEDLERIPPPQAQALGVALALRDGVGTDRFAVGAATLSLLTRYSEDQPLGLLIDDAHQLDRPSADAIAFAARRLLADPIFVIATVRDGEPDALTAAGLPGPAAGGGRRRIDPAAGDGEDPRSDDSGDGRTSPPDDRREPARDPRHGGRHLSTLVAPTGPARTGAGGTGDALRRPSGGPWPRRTHLAASRGDLRRRPECGASGLLGPRHRGHLVGRRGGGGTGTRRYGPRRVLPPAGSVRHLRDGIARRETYAACSRRGRAA